MAKQIVPSSDAPVRCVYYNKRSVFMSFLLCFYVVVMPLLAYLTEPFPWEPDYRIDWNSKCAHLNTSQCDDIVLLQARHDSLSLAPGVSFGFGAAFDVHRELVELNQTGPFLLKMPFALFYSKEARERALALGAGLLNASDFYAVTISTYIGFPLAYTCTWAVPTPNPSHVEIYVLMRLSKLPFGFHLFKLLFRLTLCGIIYHIVQRDYYRHYYHLERNLVLFGLNGDNNVFYIVVGDPTSIVLLNSYLEIAFFIDFLLSLDFMCRAMIRICQMDDYSVFFFATVYLSRTLWFTYGGLSLTSFIIKKLKFVRFYPIDPTLIALFITTLAGPLTYCQSRISFFLDFYYFLLNEISSVPENTIEIFHAGWLYMISIIFIPVCYGLIAPWICHRPRIPFEVKNYILHGISLYSLPSYRNKPYKNVARGGSVHTLFLFNHLLRRHLGMNQMAADALVISNYEDGREIRTRLTLISCVSIPTKPAKTPLSVGYLDHISCTIQQGAHSSPWFQ